MATFQQRATAPFGAVAKGSEVSDLGAADRAAAWLRGEGDLVTAGMGRPVPVPMQLGVLAHADLERLRTLGRYCRRASVKRTWGTDMARLAGDLAKTAQTAETLRQIQAEMLLPLELEALAGRRVWSRHDLVNHLRGHVLLSGRPSDSDISYPDMVGGP